MNPGNTGSAYPITPSTDNTFVMISAISIGFIFICLASLRGKLQAKSPWAGFCGLSIGTGPVSKSGNNALFWAFFIAIKTSWEISSVRLCNSVSLQD